MVIWCVCFRPALDLDGVTLLSISHLIYVCMHTLRQAPTPGLGQPTPITISNSTHTASSAKMPSTTLKYVGAFCPLASLHHLPHPTLTNTLVMGTTGYI